MSLSADQIRGNGVGEKGSIVDGTHFPTFVTEDLIKRIKTMEVREDDVWLITYPKTGTHWMKGILYQIYNYNTPEGRGETKAPDLNAEIRFAEFPDFPTGKLNIDLIENMPRGERRLLATHLQTHHMPKEFFTKKPKSIHVMRNPKDTAVSLFHFSTNNAMIREAGTWENHVDKFLEGNVIYGNHADYVNTWWDLRNDIDMLYLTYEDLKKDLKGNVLKIAKYLGVELSDETAAVIADRCTFSNMKAKGSAHVYRKGIAGGWKTTFTSDQSKRFDEFFNEKFQDLEFKFEYE